MNIKQRYNRFKAWQLKAFDWNFDENERHHCVCCDNDFVGNHCPHCSQRAGLGKVSWKSVLQSSIEVWGMNNRSLIYSLWQLMFRPGHFISDYINGKRQVSFPPVKMLIIMGVVSVVIDRLFAAPDMPHGAVKEGINQYFAWLEANPGWGWLSVSCFFLIPTWCVFRYAPRNTKHSLPQGFFIQVFMSVQVLIVDDIADFFGDIFYIVIPMCYFYTYRQLFGYGIWGNVWRVAVILVSGIMFALLAMSLTDLLTIASGTASAFAKYYITPLCILSFGSMLVGTFISKMLARRKSEQTSTSESA